MRPARGLLGVAPLAAHPAGRVVVPRVAAIRDAAECRLDQLPALLVLERLADGAGYERAPASSADPGVEVPDELLVEGDAEADDRTVVAKLEA